LPQKQIGICSEANREIIPKNSEPNRNNSELNAMKQGRRQIQGWQRAAPGGSHSKAKALSGMVDRLPTEARRV
jgi:hypothetical protein